MNILYWREPAWLLLGLLPPLWLAIQGWRSRRLGQAYADPALQPWALQRTPQRGGWWRRLCLLLAWLLIGLAAAGPRSPAWLPPDQDHSQGDLMVVLDLSRSMDAQDLWPSRRELALRALQDLLPQLAGARTGLIVYAGRAHLLLPPTADRAALAEVVGQLSGLRLPTRGSDLAGALALARQALQDAEGQAQVLVLSDMDLEAAAWQRVARLAKGLAADGSGLLLAATATEGGAALPSADGSWLQADGSTVLSRVDPAALDAVANAAVLRLTGPAAGRDLLAVLPERFGRPRLDPQAAVVWREHFPWLLLPALLLWLSASLRLAGAAPIGLAATSVYLLGLGLSQPLLADDYRDAHQALEAGDPALALSLFDRQAGYAARMGSGLSCYRLEDWACARQAFAEAVLAANGDGQRAGALYNLGHVRFQAGDYGGAARLFTDALAYRPDYPAARHNRDYARALAEEVARLADREPSGRAGRGPRSGRPATGDIPAGARLQLDDASGIALPEADTADGERQALLNRGLQYVQLAESRAEDEQHAWGGFYRQGGLGDNSDVRLWQRLVEQAEGFPATPQQPLAIPGVRPW
jgi:Ca-activated chloride channel family protein